MELKGVTWDIEKPHYILVEHLSFWEWYIRI